jgi:hypothetical protein
VGIKDTSEENKKKKIYEKLIKIFFKNNYKSNLKGINNFSINDK